MRAAVILAAGLTAAAGAQNLEISIKVSVDGVNWSSYVDALPGSVVRVGIWMSGDAGVYGMGGATLRMRGDGLRAGDQVAFALGTSTGRVAPFNFGAATNAIYYDAPGTFRIDAASDPGDANSSAGLTFFQRDPATATPGTFSTANPALCFRCDFTMGADSTFRFINLDLDQLSRGVASYFTASNASRPATAAATLHGAIIGNIPAPAAAAPLLGVLALGRRRRS